MILHPSLCVVCLINVDRPTDIIDRMIDAEWVIMSMPDRNRLIVYLYVNGYTQVEIGTLVGVSHQMVSKIVRNINKKQDF